MSICLREYPIFCVFLCICTSKKNVLLFSFIRCRSEYLLLKRMKATYSIFSANNTHSYTAQLVRQKEIFGQWNICTNYRNIILAKLLLFPNMPHWWIGYKRNTIKKMKLSQINYVFLSKLFALLKIFIHVYYYN